MEEVKFINQSTWKQKLNTYKKHPGSFVMLLLVGLSAIATMGLLLFLIAYILIKGVPHLTAELFAWTILVVAVCFLFEKLLAALLSLPERKGRVKK